MGCWVSRVYSAPRQEGRSGGTSGVEQLAAWNCGLVAAGRLTEGCFDRLCYTVPFIALFVYITLKWFDIMVYYKYDRRDPQSWN